MRVFVENFLFFSIFLGLLSGILTTLIPDGRKARAVTIAMLAVNFCLHLAVFFYTVRIGASFTYVMGAFPEPWGNELRAGPVEALLAAVFSIVMICSLLGGKADLEADILPGKQNLYYIMIDLLAASLYALCYTNDMFTGYVFIEINTIAACSLVMAKDCGQTITATLRYLIMSIVGSGIFLFGVSMLYVVSGHLLMPNLGASVQALFENGNYHYPLAVLSGMMVVGLCVKSALFPFHTWLPTAHGSATTASSAMLSGVVLKGYIILLIKIMCRVFTLENIRTVGVNNILFILGAGAMVYGSVCAITEKHAKRMIAYSSVAQVGYIFLGLGLCTEAGIAAGIFQIIAHAFAKPLLFVCVGGLAAASGHKKRLYYFRGAGRRNVPAGIGFTVGALSMVGIPLFSGFITKIVLAQACLGDTIPVWQMIVGLGAIAVSSLLNAWYYLPVVMQIWKHGNPAVEEDGEQLHPYKPDVSFCTGVYAMSAATIALGCFSAPLYNILVQAVGLL